MPLKSLAPSAALELTTFSDIDSFRPAELMEDARSIALDLTRFYAARAVVRLPSCRIVVQRSFARILDITYRSPGGLVIFSLEDGLRASANGVALDARSFVAVCGTDECRFVEPRPNLHATVILSPGMLDRGWFDRIDTLRAYPSDRNALLNARQVVFGILRAATNEPHLFEVAGVAEILQENLMLAIDDLFCIDPLSGHHAAIGGRRYAQLVRQIDEYIAAHPTSQIYTASLAAEFGVSMRTLGMAVTQVRGMSLHQYIRLKRLWAARNRLLKGGDGITVGTCARAYGFYHMGEFAALYRATFGEAPSTTLARGRQAQRTAAPRRGDE
jgi:AraC family ethanolamine operon transcriptional activator